MKKFVIAAVVGVSILASGCATVVTGDTQVVTINSNAPEAEVLVNGILVGKTPFNGPIKKGQSTSVTVRKAGFQERTVQLATDVEAAFFGNIIIGGLLGSTTDYGSGSMYKYSPNTIQIDLEPIKGK